MGKAFEMAKAILDVLVSGQKEEEKYQECLEAFRVLVHSIDITFQNW